MTVKPVGGRGKKAPYETVVIRIPKELEGLIEAIVNKYREKVLSGYTRKDRLLGFTSKSREEVETIKEKILKSRKSARYSLEKFIQDVYSE